MGNVKLVRLDTSPVDASPPPLHSSAPLGRHLCRAASWKLRKSAA